MSERLELLSSIAEITADYRKDDLPQPTAGHVDRWVNQFDAAVQVPILRETLHVLKQTYISRETVKSFFGGYVSHDKLTGGNPKDFWSKAHILDIQQNGQSQSHIRELLGEALDEQLNLKIDTCGGPGGSFIYVDDVIFSGSRFTTDMTAWVKNTAPKDSNVHALVMVTHQLGEWQSKKRIKASAAAEGKAVNLEIWAALRLENRVAYRNSSDVLWPAEVPDDPSVLAYVAQEERFPFQTRTAGASTSTVDIFSSDEGRQLLEREFLRAGVRIRGFSQNPSPIVRPLGFSSFGVGFGSTIVTYRNCPNNAPLALWWGDPNAQRNHPFSKWYPLLQRRTYE